VAPNPERLIAIARGPNRAQIGFLTDDYFVHVDLPHSCATSPVKDGERDTAQAERLEIEITEAVLIRDDRPHVLLSIGHAMQSPISLGNLELDASLIFEPKRMIDESTLKPVDLYALMEV
jgi:hypothetical protein